MKITNATIYDIFLIIDLLKEVSSFYLHENKTDDRIRCVALRGIEQRAENMGGGQCCHTTKINKNFSG